MSDDKKTSPKTEKVTLTQGHTHAGKDYKPNDQLDVPPHVADYLVKRGKAERAK